jgi:hypothetical protein
VVANEEVKEHMNTTSERGVDFHLSLHRNLIPVWVLVGRILDQFGRCQSTASSIFHSKHKISKPFSELLRFINTLSRPRSA